MVLLRPPFSSKHCFSLRWLRQCSRALSPENKFSGPPLCSRGLRCSKFSLQRNFQGLLSIVQLSRFLSFFSSDSFNILSKLISFVKNFFIFLSCLIRFPFGPLQATACIGYHICKALSRTFFQRFRFLSSAFLLPGRSASASPAELIFGGFKSPSSATGAILSPLEVIVNVFSIFYLFQTICAIQYFQITVQLFSSLTPA